MTDLHSALHAAVAERTAAAQRHSSAVAALERAQQARAAAEAECARLADQDDAAIERAAKRFEAHARTGDAGASPEVAPSDRHLVAEIVAARTLKAADRAIASLEADLEQSAAELRRADALLHGARGALVGGRVRELLDELGGVRKREEEIVRLIAVIGPRDPGASHLPTAAAAAVNDPPARPSLLGLLGSPGGVATVNDPIGGQPAAVERARSYWTDYLACLERDAAPAAPAEAA